jgi:DNA-binding MarR family transcriptional regulator
MSSKNPQRSPRTLYLVKRAETAIRGGLESCLQPLSVTPAQYVTLSLLNEPEDQSSAELARKAGITPQSMSETIATLEKKGLICRTKNPGHRRILSTKLTDAGATLLKQCDASVDKLEISLLDDISATDLDNLRAMLRKIIGTKQKT